MAGKISISTEVLREQALKLAKLSTQVHDIHTKAKRAIALIHEASNSKYSSDMKAKGDILLNNAYVLADKLSEGCIIAVRAAENFENTDKIIRESIKGIPEEVLNTQTSSQTVAKPIDESVYNQKAYSQFMEYYDYDYDGDLDYINTGCVITSCAYVLTCMGIETTPLQAYERSGGCNAVYNEISQYKAYITMDQPVHLIDEMAKKAKTDPNISPLILRVSGNTHTVVLKDIEIDSTGKITKYIVFDPAGAAIKEYTNISQTKVTNFDYYTRA